MHRKGWVCCGIGLALAFGTLACGQPAQPGEPAVAPTQAEDRPPPGPNEVRITVVCPPAQANGAAFQVRVNPPFRAVDYGTNVEWTRTKLPMANSGVHSDEFTIDVATEQERLDWPWTRLDDDGNNQLLPWSGDTSIVGIAKDSQDTDAKKYSITLKCNDDTTTIDPRMKVIPQ